MYISVHVKHPSFLSDFNRAWTFSTDFRKKCSNKKQITCSIYDSTNSWRDNVFSRNDVSKEENDKIK
jgi:hypothetical protein